MADVTSVNATGALTSSFASSGSQLGKQEFLELLVAQLENQDPLDPLDNTAFVAQLAEFSQLEQLFNVNDTMTGNSEISMSIHNAMMTNMIGKNVKYSSDNLYWTGDALPEITYNVPSDGDVIISVMNASGELVYQTQEGQAAGENSFQWNGRDSNGNEAVYGSYYFTAVHADSEGGQTILSPFLDGKITALQYEDGSTLLYSGDQLVNPENILAIYQDE